MPFIPKRYRARYVFDDLDIGDTKLFSIRQIKRVRAAAYSFMRNKGIKLIVRRHWFEGKWYCAVQRQEK